MKPFFVAEVLIVIFLAGAFIFFFRKKFGKRLLIGFAAIILLCGIISGNLIELVPIPTEPVTLTALNEKNKDAADSQVAISKIVVDDKKYEQKNPSQGKWFWRGDELWWRRADDPRQPEGVTETIVLDIPIGNSRMIEFASYYTRGMVKVESGDKSEVIDTYIPKDSPNVNVFTYLSPTNPSKVKMFKLFKLALYILIIVLLAFYPVFAVLKFGKERVKGWCGRNWDKVYYILVASVGLIITFNIGKGGTLWRDEIWNIGWIYNGFSSYKLWSLLQIVWFKIVPYGQEYLLLLSEIQIALTVFIYGLIGSSLKSKRFGVILSTLCATSSTIIFQGSMEFRNYAMVFLSSALAVFFFIKKQKEIGKEKISTLILYGVSLAMVMDSHTIGIIFAGLLMVSDFVVIIAKKRVKGLVEFIIPVIYGVYWLCSTFQEGLATMAQGYSFARDPSVKNFIDFLYYLCGSSWLNVALFILGYLIVIGYLIFRISENRFDWRFDFMGVVFVVLPAIYFAFLIIFSNSFTNVTLFNQRYFTQLIVFLIIFIGISIDKFIQLLSDRKEHIPKTIASSVLTLSICVMLCTINWYNQKADSRDNYKGISQYLMSQNDIYLSSTVCIIRGNTNMNVGFEYYLSHNGERDSVNHIDMYADFTKYDTIYLVYPAYSSYDEKAFTNKGYKKIAENSSLKIRKYVKKS